MQNLNLKERFHAEVLKFGAQAVLPKNLNDNWLELLTFQALLHSNENVTSDCPELLAAVLSILFMKANYQDLHMDQSELFNYLHLYSIELYVEKLNRTGNAKIDSATIDTILTDESFHKTTELAEVWRKA